MSRFLALISLLVLTSVAQASQEPWTGGRPLSQWTEDLGSGDPAVVSKALITLRTMGPDAGALHERLVPLMKSEHEPVRVGAANVLAAIGGPSFDYLLDEMEKGQLEQRQVASAATHHLVFLTAAQEKRLTALVASDHDQIVRIASARLLARLAPESDAMLETFGAMLDSKHIIPGLKIDVLQDLKRMGHRAAPVALPMIRTVVFHPEERVRDAGVEALRACEGCALPALIDFLMGDNSPKGLRTIANLVQAIGQKKPDPTQALYRLTKHNDVDVRVDALMALAEVGTPTPALLDDLRARARKLSNPALVHALAKLSTDPKRDAHELAPTLFSWKGNPFVVGRAFSAFEQHAFDALEEQLGSASDGAMKARWVRVLGGAIAKRTELGRRYFALVAPLLSSPEPEVRESASLAFDAPVIPAPEVARSIVSGFASTDPGVRESSVTAIHHILRQTQPLLFEGRESHAEHAARKRALFEVLASSREQLRKLTAAKSWQTAHCARVALAAIGETKTLHEEIAAAIDSEEGLTTLQVVGLAIAGPSSAPFAAPVVQRALDERQHQKARWHARQALVAMGKAGAAALGKAIEGGATPPSEFVGAFGANGAPLVAPIVARIQTEQSKYDRFMLMAMLGSLESAAAPARAYVAGLLAEDRHMRKGAAVILGWTGAAALDQAPALFGAALKHFDTDGDFVAKATDALAQMGSGVVPVITKAGEDAPWNEIAASHSVLWKLEKDGRAAVPLLLKRAKHRQSDLRMSAARLLASFFLDQPGVSQAVSEALRDPLAQVRYGVVKALADEGTLPEALRAQVESLAKADPSPHVRTTASRALK